MTICVFYDFTLTTRYGSQHFPTSVYQTVLVFHSFALSFSVSHEKQHLTTTHQCVSRQNLQQWDQVMSISQVFIQVIYVLPYLQTWGRRQTVSELQTLYSYYTLAAVHCDKLCNYCSCNQNRYWFKVSDHIYWTIIISISKRTDVWGLWKSPSFLYLTYCNSNSTIAPDNFSSCHSLSLVFNYIPI